MNNRSFCNISAGNQDYYLLSKELKDNNECDGFELALCDGTNVWCGTVTADALKVNSKKIHIEYEEMLTQTCKALTRDKMGNMIFVYDVKTLGTDNLQFIWKQHVTTESIKFQLGTVNLQRSTSPPDIMCQIFEHAIESVGVLQEKITALQSDNERLVSERAAAIKRLEKHVNVKVDIENDLYSKFVVVLNDKKAKIRELRDFGQSLPDDEASAESGDPGSSRTSAAVNSDSETDGDVSEHGDREVPMKREYNSEYNTDEDEKPASVPFRKKNKIKKESPSLLVDSSLMLDDGGDNDEEHAPVTRRRGRTASGKKQTPSKPIIPKVPSSESKDTPGTSRRSGRTSMKKSPSLNSSKSENMDELMEHL